MKNRKIELNWHTVCGLHEITDLAALGLIRELKASRHRHLLFLSIQRPGVRFYRGPWGPELLETHESDPYIGITGRVRTTYERFTEIQQVFTELMFEARSKTQIFHKDK